MTNTQKIVLIVLITVWVIVLGLALYWLFNELYGGEERNPTPTLSGTPAPPTPTGDVSWWEVQSAGKMIVGTSGDYPPFDYYDSNFQLDGFDIALMRKIGERLGVQISFQDIAFDGLGNALLLNQIDSSIAAISVTPQREAQVDFTNVYLVGEDAVLANQNSSISVINLVDQMAPYRVGVQAGSIYQRWLTDTLVSTGKMPTSNLLAYTYLNQAVTDLQSGRIDLVVLDLPPAENYVKLGGVKLVGQDMNLQYYAIALPPGANALRNEINRALGQLQQEGVINQLSQQYLGYVPITNPPMPTPGPVLPTPTTPAGCFDGMAYVADLNYPDYNMTAPPAIPAGTPFTKGWRIKNSGTCTWNSAYRLVYAGGNVPAAQMGGQPTPVKGIVPPGATYDMYVNLVAPLTPGTYQGFWQMNNGYNQAFGQRIWVGIVVPSLPTPSPAPSQTPVPGITFTAQPTNIQAGYPVLFSWSAPGATAVYFYAQGEAWQQNQVPVTGNATEYPHVTTLYELRVVFPNGSVENRQILIQVQQIEQAPIIQRFALNPAGQISLGQCVEIQWQVAGTVTKIILSRSGQTLWDGAPVSGTTRDCPVATGAYTYVIEASGPGGTSRAQQNLNVVAQPPTVTAIPPTQVPAPIINSFTVNPGEVDVGGCVSLAWSVGGGADLVQLLRNGVVVLDHAPLQGGGQDCLNTAGVTVYLIQASNRQGQVVTDQKSVIVHEGPPPFAGRNWRLISYDINRTLTPVLEGTSIDAAFGVDGSLGGSAGCNSYSSTYSVSGNTITLAPISVGAMSCSTPDGIMQQESTYLADLQSASRYQLNGTELSFMDTTGRTVLVFSEMPTPR